MGSDNIVSDNKYVIIHEMYVNKKMSTNDIGRVFDVSYKTVCRWLKEYGISNRRSPLSDEEKEIIFRVYKKATETNTPLILDDLVTILNRSKITISRYARTLGMTDTTRSKKHYTNEDCGWSHEKIQYLLNNYQLVPYYIMEKELGFCEDKIRKMLQHCGLIKPIVQHYRLRKPTVWKNGHPKGMLGKHHTTDICDDMSKRIKDLWNNPNSVFNSDEFKQGQSDRMMEHHAKNKQSNPYSRTRSGKRPDLNNVFFRSSWEANYARYLNFLIEIGEINKWKYEPDRFEFTQINRGIRSYLPDFKIWDTSKSTPYYHEIKGWMDTKSKMRLNRMTKYYPHIKLVVIGRKEYMFISKLLLDVIPNWEA